MFLVTSYSNTEKLRLLSDAQDSDYQLTVLSDYLQVRDSNMRKWIKQFLLSGLSGIIRPKHNRKYPIKIKRKASEDYLEGILSTQEILIKYQIRNVSQLHQWIIQHKVASY